MHHNIPRYPGNVFLYHIQLTFAQYGYKLALLVVPPPLEVVDPEAAAHTLPLEAVDPEAAAHTLPLEVVDTEAAAHTLPLEVVDTEAAAHTLPFAA